MHRQRRVGVAAVGDAALVISTGAATLLVLLILAMLVIDVVRGGSAAPQLGRS